VTCGFGGYLMANCYYSSSHQDQIDWMLSLFHPMAGSWPRLLPEKYGYGRQRTVDFFAHGIWGMVAQKRMGSSFHRTGKF